MYPYYSLFGLQLPTYGLMAALGALAAAVYIFAANRRVPGGRLSNEDLTLAGLSGLTGAIVGAKALGMLTALPIVLQNWAVLKDDALLLLRVAWGGMVFYGGLLGGLWGAWLFCRRYQVNFQTLAALAAPAIPLFHVFGRVGCFLGGCCWGIEVPWGLVYHQSIGGPNGVALLPVQLIEAGCNLVLFIGLAIAVRRMQRPWMALPLYLAIYAVLRFVLEFFRGDKIRGVFLLSTSQWISLAILVVLGVLTTTRWRRKSPVPPEDHP